MDFFSPAFIADPYPTYRRLREAGPLHPLAPGLWLATRHGVVDALLRDGRFGKDYLSGVMRRYSPERAATPVFATLNRSILLMNPPAHTRLKVLVGKAFSVKQAADLRRLAQREADRLLARFIHQGRADLVREFAYPLPIAVICALMGLSLEDALLFQRETQALVKVFELVPLNDADLAAAQAAADTFDSYFRELLAKRRRRPGDDLVSLLLRAEEGDDRLGEDEIVANVMLLFMAGHETTANMIGNALVALFCHPEQLKRLRGDWSLLPKAVDECLRYDGSVHLAARVALMEVQVEGVHVARGDTVYLNLGAANRDPAVFAEPDRLFIDRPEEGKANPLSFGGGIHYCLGARLARIELETTLEALLTRLPNLSIEGLDAPRWKSTTTVRGLECLWATWSV